MRTSPGPEKEHGRVYKISAISSVRRAAQIRELAGGKAGGGCGAAGEAGVKMHTL